MSSPFAVEFFSPVSDLEILQDIGNGKAVVAAPTPHPLFSRYIVQATAELGVVWIKGLGEVIGNDNFGTATKAAVDRLSEQLSSKYGTGQKQDFLMTGSIWSDPQDWMAALNHNERAYNVMWERGGRGSLPDDIESIFLGAVPLEGYAAQIVLEYASTKVRAAEAELERQMATLL